MLGLEQKFLNWLDRVRLSSDSAERSITGSGVDALLPVPFIGQI